MAGGTSDPSTWWSGPWWPWAAFILPNMEMGNLYNAINFSAHGQFTFDANAGGNTCLENSTVYRTITTPWPPN